MKKSERSIIIDSAITKAARTLKESSSPCRHVTDKKGDVDFRSLFIIALDEADRKMESVSYTSSGYKGLVQEIRRGLRKVIKMNRS